MNVVCGSKKRDVGKFMMNKNLFNNELDKRTAHILVVEDDECTRLTICQFLKKRGYQVSTAENGRQAVDMVSNQAPDIILMDVSMPEMDGIEATATIRQELACEHVPILIITSFSDEERVNLAFEAGATEFVSKPIHWTVLDNRLKHLWQSIQKTEISRLAAMVLENTNEGMIITDAKMTIVALNSAFSAITGYSEDEAVGQTPRLLQSGRQDKAFYQAMWATLTAEGQWAGEVWNRRKNGEVYPEWLNISAVKNQSGLVTHYVGAFSDISVLKAKEERLRQLAHFDGLTGLANRLLFRDRFEQAIAQARRAHHKVAFFYIDLDNFKPVNDTYGHDTGDTVLQISAQRLTQTIREVDTACRLGGDEFGIILHDIKQTEDASIVAERVIQAIAKPIVVNDVDVVLGCSIGIGVYPDNGKELDSLVKLADTAMYCAKQAGKNQYRFCSEI